MRDAEDGSVRTLKEIEEHADSRSFIIGEWEEEDDKWIICGRCIQFDKAGHTLYLGYLWKGQRHGWGMEIPLKNTSFRDKYRVNQYKEGQLMLPEEEEKLKELSKKEIKKSSTYLNLLLFNILEKNGLIHSDSPVANYLTHRYYIPSDNDDEEKPADVAQENGKVSGPTKLSVKDFKFNWNKGFDLQKNREIREGNDAKAEIIKQNPGSEIIKATYSGELTNTYNNTNVDPEIEGRGIMVVNTNDIIQISVGSFDNAKL